MSGRSAEHDAGLDSPDGRDRRQTIGLWLGLILALGLQLIPVPTELNAITGSASDARSAWIVLSLLSLMACWWVSEAVPIPVTSLLPLAVLPVCSVQSIRQTSGDYFHPIVVLLLGGFIVAKAIERWNLHERIALGVVSKGGVSPGRVIGGFMMAAAMLSMWISNTATSIMMMPIAVSVALAVTGDRPDGRGFTFALLLGIAYACSIGGLGTYIGTPTNLLIKDALEGATGREIDFFSWMMLGVPTVTLLVPLAWFVLTRWAFQVRVDDVAAGQAVISERLAALGRITTPERRTIMVFGLVAALWIFGRPLRAMDIGGFSPLAGMTDHVIAIFGVILCFLVPSGSRQEPGSSLLDWKTAESIPWGVILLFGGGMALAGAIRGSGLGDWVGSELDFFAALPVLLVVLLVATLVIFVTEVTSNIATAAALAPVLISLADRTDLDPVLLGAPVALAASCAFMLPMATGPNAVVFATDRVNLPTMARAGVRLNLLAIFAITALSWLIAPLAFG
ncbi:MAG: SLC13 family permease [Pseudomonadota bacterium]